MELPPSIVVVLFMSQTCCKKELQQTPAATCKFQPTHDDVKDPTIFSSTTQTAKPHEQRHWQMLASNQHSIAKTTASRIRAFPYVRCVEVGLLCVPDGRPETWQAFSISFRVRFHTKVLFGYQFPCFLGRSCLMWFKLVEPSSCRILMMATKPRLIFLPTHWTDVWYRKVFL